jgi:hypothetical protein
MMIIPFLIEVLVRVRVHVYSVLRYYTPAGTLTLSRHQNCYYIILYLGA